MCLLARSQADKLLEGQFLVYELPGACSTWLACPLLVRH